MEDTVDGIQKYFAERAYLASLRSEFACNPTCLRPGCRSPQIQIPATIFDAIGAAAHRNKSVSAALLEGFVLGLLPVTGQDRIVRVALKIRKPCPYLRNEICTIYEVRPLACILFPERSFVSGTAKEMSNQEHFRDYPCLRHDCEVSQERAQVIRQLTGMLQQEILVSDCHLFGCSPFFLDLRDLMPCLAEREVMPGERSGASIHSEELFTIQHFDDLFRKLFNGYAPFEAFEKKVAELENVPTRQGLFKYFRDKRAMRRLVGRYYDSQRLFRPVQGVLKAKRMSLIPSECRFQ